MPNFINLEGHRFCRLTVLNLVAMTKWGATWNCLCECGNSAVVYSNHLRRGLTRSCGCLQREKASIVKHGHCKDAKRPTREYHAWHNMKQRVLNPLSPNFKNYGGRGIRVCERWLNSFPNFLQDMGKCPEGLELDRIDVNGNYEPSNCRWTDEITQARNQRRRLHLYPELVPQSVQGVINA